MPVGLPGMLSRTLCPEPAQGPLAATDSRGTPRLPGMMKMNAVVEEGRSAFQTKSWSFLKLAWKTSFPKPKEHN